MAVVHAEAAARRAGREEAVTLPATTSAAAAPGAEADVTVTGDQATLRVRGLPRPAPGAGYRVWLLDGAPPRLPRPGPPLELDPRGCAELDLGALGDAEEVIVAPHGADDAPRGHAVLCVRLPPGVATGRGR